MKLKIYITILTLSVLACKKKSEDSPTPTSGTNTPTSTEQTCTWGQWSVTKQGADIVDFKNGCLNMFSKHAKIGGRHSYTSVSTSCTLVGDFELRIDVPFLSLSDSAGKGSLFAQVFASNAKYYSATLGRDASSMGGSSLGTYKFIASPSTKATFTFKRNGGSLYSKLAYDGDSLESIVSAFGIEPLYLVLGALCDSSAKMPTQAHIEKLTVKGGGGSFVTDELTTGLLK